MQPHSRVYHTNTFWLSDALGSHGRRSVCDDVVHVFPVRTAIRDLGLAILLQHQPLTNRSIRTRDITFIVFATSASFASTALRCEADAALPRLQRHRRHRLVGVSLSRFGFFVWDPSRRGSLKTELLVPLSV